MRARSLVTGGFFAIGITWCAACGDDEPVRLPPPTGTVARAMGRSTLRWVDKARLDEDGTPRELTVHLYYPASAEPAESARCFPDLDAIHAAGAIDEQTHDVWQLVRCHTAEGVAVAGSSAGALPLVVFSEGDDMVGAQYTFLLEELASYGYIVASLDHPRDARAVLTATKGVVGYAADSWPALPPPPSDGKPDPTSEYARHYRARVDARAEDVRFVLDQLFERAVPEGVDPALASRIDHEHVGIIGHSVGGVAAAEVCMRDPRVSACANLDGESPEGPFYLNGDGRAFRGPFMMVTKTFDVPDAQLTKWGLTRDQWRANVESNRARYFGAVEKGSYRVVIEGASHESFSDEPFVLSSIEEDGESEAHAKRMALVRSYVVAFFDEHVRARPSPLLEPNAPALGGANLQSWPAR